MRLTTSDRLIDGLIAKEWIKSLMNRGIHSAAIPFFFTCPMRTFSISIKVASMNPVTSFSTFAKKTNRKKRSKKAAILFFIV